MKASYLEWHIGTFKNLYTGTIKNLSEKGMFLSTKYKLSSDSLVEICIPVVKKRILGIPVRTDKICIAADCVSIVWDKKGPSGGIGIEITRAPAQYLELLESIKTVS